MSESRKIHWQSRGNKNISEEGTENGIDERTKIFEIDTELGKITAEVASGEILQRDDGNGNSKGGLSQAERGGYRVFEEREIRETVNEGKFRKMSEFLVNEISHEIKNWKNTLPEKMTV